jgi:serine/threonine protein kinase
MSGSDETTRGTMPAMLLPTPVVVGAQFDGRYLVRRQVGQGGMGTVYAAHDMMLGEPVALKVLRPMVAEDEVVVQRFRREVKLARRVAHRNVARTYDIDVCDGLHYLTMELVEGTTLSAVLRDQPRLSVKRAVDIASQICLGLEAAHRENVVHRDLKPGNVLLEPTGRVVITDFGVARTMSDGLLTGDPNIMVGTPAYMAPEQITSGEIGAHTDIYSLGLVLYEMLTGQIPFRAETPIGTAFARLKHDPVDPGTLVEHLPAELSALILRCLAREPAKRPGSARELMELLALFRHGRSDSSLVDGLLPRDTLVPTQLGISASFASIRMGTLSMAVLPMRYRGPEADAYIAEAITEELVDILSRTRGLKVLSAAASARFSEERDPTAVREQLGVGVMVDGAVQRQGDQLRVTARLVDTGNGVQVWSERFDGKLEDVLELQDRIANRIAEALRLELDSHRHTEGVPGSAVELYMRARGFVRRFDLGGTGPEGAERLLTRCLEQAPEFPPALATRALVLARLWSIYGDGQAGEGWAARCREAVALALEQAPDQPESQLAAGIMHCERGHYRAAAQALRDALRLAPTYAAAHAHLGALQCEAGRAQEGYRHLTMAVELDPLDPRSLLSVALYHAQRGDYAPASGVLARIPAEDPTTQGAIAIMYLRMSLWRSRPDMVRALQRGWTSADPPRRRLLELLAGVYLGRVEGTELDRAIEGVMQRDASPRVASTIQQLATEVLAARGELDAAFEHLRRAAEDVLVDVEWLTCCPVLADLRSRPGFAPLAMQVRQRAAAIWSA